MNVLYIGPDIRIIVLGIKGQQVRIGIQAPPTVIVDREEVHQRKMPSVSLPDIPVQQFAFRGSTVPGAWGYILEGLGSSSWPSSITAMLNCRKLLQMTKPPAN